jgi:tetratricopeptide (TPR) repeat protein
VLALSQIVDGLCRTGIRCLSRVIDSLTAARVAARSLDTKVRFLSGDRAMGRTGAADANSALPVALWSDPDAGQGVCRHRSDRGSGEKSAMYRVFLCAAAALLAAAVQSTAAVDHAAANLRRLCQSGMGDERVAACSRLIELRPDHAYFYASRGMAYYDNGDYDHAIADANEAIRLNPNDFFFYVVRGFARFRKGDYDQAISDYYRAIELKPKLALAYDALSDAYNHRGDRDRAIAAADEAIRLAPPKFGLAYYHRGEAYEAMNDPDHALADFDQALKLDPSLADARAGRERVQALLAKRPPGAQTNVPPR